MPFQWSTTTHWLEAVVAEADIIEDRKPLEAAVLAVMGHHPTAHRAVALSADRI